LLRIEELELAYDASGSKIFAALSLAIEANQAIALSGPSGVGKSTLLRCMAGLEARAKGTLHFGGKPVLPKAVPSFRRQAVYVPQTPPRMAMSVEDSLRIAFAFRNQDLNYDPEQAASLCEQLLLPKKLLKQRMAELSGGEAQRFGLLRALTIKPTILLLDEPVSSLDAKARSAVAKVIAEWFGEGDRSVVISSHEPSWCQSLLTGTWQLEAGGNLITSSKDS
jgi:ABC-type iron transport system FetAB ATPase subunit